MKDLLFNLLSTMPLTGPYRLLNLIEAEWWIVLGLVAIGFVLARKLSPKTGLLLAATLVAFGLSDVVEVQTGAWYRPWWMLLWKATCVVILLGYGLAWWRCRAQARHHGFPRGVAEDKP